MPYFLNSMRSVAVAALLACFAVHATASSATITFPLKAVHHRRFVVQPPPPGTPTHPQYRGVRVYHPRAFKDHIARSVNVAFGGCAYPGCATAPLFGNLTGTGMFYVGLTLGTSPATYYVQVDTGSSDLAVYSTADPATPANTPMYNPWASASAVPVLCTNPLVVCSCPGNATTGNCTYSDTYADGSGFSAQVPRWRGRPGCFPLLCRVVVSQSLVFHWCYCTVVGVSRAGNVRGDVGSNDCVLGCGTEQHRQLRERPSVRGVCARPNCNQLTGGHRRES